MSSSDPEALQGKVKDLSQKAHQGKVLEDRVKDLGLRSHQDKVKDLGPRSHRDKAKDLGHRAQQVEVLNCQYQDMVKVWGLRWVLKGFQPTGMKASILTGQRDFPLQVLTLHFKVILTIHQPMGHQRNFKPKGLGCIHPTSSHLAIRCLGQVSILILITP